ncbi:hypothetical protein GBAR_LOCUS29739 [Geodia barretti]|nr:hypothetical protein GBAR_LOCUS29739 [Geodia barretti]
MTLIVVPFGVLSQKYQLVHKAKKCSCCTLSKHRCLPFYGNVLPRPPIGYHNGSVRDISDTNYDISILRCQGMTVLEPAALFCNKLFCTTCSKLFCSIFLHGCNLLQGVSSNEGHDFAVVYS